MTKCSKFLIHILEVAGGGGEGNMQYMTYWRCATIFGDKFSTGHRFLSQTLSRVLFEKIQIVRLNLRDSFQQTS